MGQWLLGGYVCGGTAHAEGFLPYDPSATYTIDSDINVDVYFHYVDESGYETGEYSDYYDFFEFSEWDLIFYPLSFAFTGNGPPRVSSVQNILLGTLTSLFEQGATSGPPHHLKVILDHDFERIDMCNQLQKNIQFRVVDFAGRSAGRMSIDEKPQNITDTCSNTTVSMSSCSGQTSTFGNFTDGLRTGCPWNGQANCGFILQNQWRWCSGGPYATSGPVVLASMTYEVRRSVVRVDGQSDIPEGADKYP